MHVRVITQYTQPLLSLLKWEGQVITVAGVNILVLGLWEENQGIYSFVVDQ